jgi:hypothetical protein
MSSSVSKFLNLVQFLLLFHSVRSSISRAEAVRRHGEESSVQTRTSSGSSTTGKGSCPSSWTKSRLSSSFTTFSGTYCTGGAQALAKPDIPSPPPIWMRNKLDWFCAIDLYKTSPSRMSKAEAIDPWNWRDWDGPCMKRGARSRREERRPAWVISRCSRSVVTDHFPSVLSNILLESCAGLASKTILLLMSPPSNLLSLTKLTLRQRLRPEM